MKSNILQYLQLLIVSLVIVVPMIKVINSSSLDVDYQTNSLLRLFILLLIIHFASKVNIFLHEFGHYLFGKLSGYEFVSFRVFNTIYIKKNGKLVKNRLKIVGTSGQCVMMPPSLENSPFVLYNLGGVIVNACSSLVFYGLSLIFIDIQYLRYSFTVLACYGVASAISNGFPLKLLGLPNDGYNVISLLKSKRAQRAFYIQLAVNAGVTNGQKIKDMPGEWFKIDDDADFNDPLLCASAYFSGLYQEDKLNFNGAKEIYENLLQSKGLVSIHRNEIECELLFFELIGDCDKYRIKNLYTRKLKKYIKTTAEYYPSRSRLMYAYYTLYKKDFAKANKAKATFEKRIKTYPFSGEIHRDVEMMNLIQQKSEVYND